MGKFKPSYIYPPGYILRDTLDVREIAYADFAAATAIDLEALMEIFEGNTIITPELATAFVEQLGGDVDFWLDYERLHREELAQQAKVVG